MLDNTFLHFPDCKPQDKPNPYPLPNVYPPDKCDTLRPPKPMFTVQEEFIATTRRVNEALDRVLHTEEHIRKTLDGYMSTISADNVAFKNLCVTTYNQFAETVHNEVNSFETEILNAYELFKNEVNGNYEEFVLKYDTFKSEVDTLIEAFETDITKALNDYKEELNTTYDNFREAIESRLEMHNEAHTEAFNNYVTQVNANLSEMESHFNKDYADFVKQINQTVTEFKTEWVETINARLDGQDSVINDAVLYFKSNIGATVSGLLNTMKENGELETMIDAEILPDKVTFFDSVADLKTRMESANLKLNGIVATRGYYEPNDGGECYYIVVKTKNTTLSKTYGFDIKNSNGSMVLRPFVSNEINPLMFGAKPNEACTNAIYHTFSYASYRKIPTINGLGHKYIVGQTKTRGAFNDHWGIIFEANTNAEIKNFHFVLNETNADIEMVTLLNLGLKENVSYHIHDCIFDGNRNALNEITLGREDGGRHCLYFGFDGEDFPRTFKKSGNITIENCKFINPDSYGVVVPPCDCTLKIDNCHFETFGPAILPGALTSYISNCTGTINESYKTMVLNFCHDEMEMGGTYSGAKVYKSLYMNNCRVSCWHLFKIEDAPQQGIHYKQIFIENSENKANRGGILFANNNGGLATTNYEEIRIKGCECGAGSHNDTLYSVAINKGRVGLLYIDNDDIFMWHDKDGTPNVGDVWHYSHGLKGELAITNCSVYKFHLHNWVFNGDTFILLNGAKINAMVLDNFYCYHSQMDTTFKAIGTYDEEGDYSQRHLIRSFIARNGYSTAQNLCFEIRACQVDVTNVRLNSISNGIDTAGSTGNKGYTEAHDFLKIIYDNANSTPHIHLNNVVACRPFAQYNYLVGVHRPNGEGYEVNIVATNCVGVGETVENALPILKGENDVLTLTGVGVPRPRYLG